MPALNDGYYFPVREMSMGRHGFEMGAVNHIISVGMGEKNPLAIGGEGINTRENLSLTMIRESIFSNLIYINEFVAKMHWHNEVLCIITC